MIIYAETISLIIKIKIIYHIIIMLDKYWFQISMIFDTEYHITLKYKNLHLNSQMPFGVFYIGIWHSVYHCMKNY